LEKYKDWELENGIWKVEGIKRGRVWAIIIIKVDLEGVGFRNLVFV